MSRERVSKGQIIMKKEEKLPLVAKVMELNFSDADFLEMFKYMYPKDWENIETRYAEHLKVNKGKKDFPMAEPMKHLHMVSKKHIEAIRNEHKQDAIISPEESMEIKEKERSKSLAKMQKNQESGGTK